MAHTWAPPKAVGIGLCILSLAALFNLLQALFAAPTAFLVIAPLTLYAFGIALIMPSLSLLALDCFPRNRGMAASVQSFMHMGGNALVASLLVPLILGHLLWFALGQAALLLAAVIAWIGALRLAPGVVPDEAVSRPRPE